MGTFLPLGEQPLAPKPRNIRFSVAQEKALEQVGDRSAFVRAAVQEKIEREGLQVADQD